VVVVELACSKTELTLLCHKTETTVTAVLLEVEELAVTFQRLTLVEMETMMEHQAQDG
jgi:hypothetical protein